MQIIATNGEGMYTHDIPTLMRLEEATVRGIVVIARDIAGAPVFYYHRTGAGKVAHTRMINLAAPFNDYRIAKIFMDFWVRCDTTLGAPYLVTNKRLA
jgi:hypothetical protein